MFCVYDDVTDANMFFPSPTNKLLQHLILIFRLGSFEKSVYEITSLNIFLSILQRRSNEPTLTNQRYSVNDGVLTCSFTRPAAVTKNLGPGLGLMSFNLDSESFHLLMAFGRAVGSRICLL